MNNTEFTHFYARRRQALDVLFKDNEFLYPHNEPWPESSFDYPYGQAPTVSNIPPPEAADWDKNVGQYYSDNAVGTSKHPTPFGIKSAEFSRERFEKNGISGYASISDEQFLELICEGLYSKYLGPLDPQDEKLFGVSSSNDYQYLKSDQSCMKVVKKPWPGEYVAPAIAIVRRKLPLTEENRWDYELVAIALAAKENPDDANSDFEFRENLVFDAKNHASSSAWWLAKFYVLQGAIHRINLIDHIKVHFPSDTINAITKSALPRWHLVQQLLMPHFRLTLPVNNAVLEGARSLINRDTWYPWSPVTANGEEIRKLIPFSWGGSKYYWDEKNSSYPRYAFSLDPDSIVDPDDLEAQPIPSFIGLQASRYAQFLKDYYAPVLIYTRAVIAQLPDPTENLQESDITWLEIQRWAHEISKLVPNFPDETAINDKETLARTCATIIWNAAIVHSSDHSTLHMMIDKYPVPFILRVRPPKTNDSKVTETIGEALGEKGMQYLTGAVNGLEHLLEHAVSKNSIIGKLIIDTAGEKLIKKIEKTTLKEGTVPLCWPTDLIYAKMADLLFYRPHSSSLLYDCDYEFLIPPEQLSDDQKQLEAEWEKAGRPILSAADKLALKGIRTQFQAHLTEVNDKYYDANGAPTLYPETDPDFKPTDIPCPLNRYGFPKLIPGKEDKNVTETRMECCFTAGIQY